jgi:hypothetical protein
MSKKAISCRLSILRSVINVNHELKRRLKISIISIIIHISLLALSTDWKERDRNELP